MNYTTLSLADVRAGLEDVARDAHTAFGALDARQLNWRPDESRWSVAQGFQHLLNGDRADAPGVEGCASKLLNQAIAPLLRYCLIQTMRTPQPKFRLLYSAGVCAGPA